MTLEYKPQDMKLTQHRCHENLPCYLFFLGNTRQAHESWCAKVIKLLERLWPFSTCTCSTSTSRCRADRSLMVLRRAEWKMWDAEIKDGDLHLDLAEEGCRSSFSKAFRSQCTKKLSRPPGWTTVSFFFKGEIGALYLWNNYSMTPSPSHIFRECVK